LGVLWGNRILSEGVKSRDW